MNGYKIISVLGLLILVTVLPIYTLWEPERMEQAQISLRREFVTDAALIYVENCALCHGGAGEGIGANPPLNDPALWTTDYDFLFKTIARGRYGTTMAGWHVDEGGILNSYQIDELVALIRYVDWSMVGELAANQGLIPPTLPVPEVEDALIEAIVNMAPEGNEWAEGIQHYAENCTVCHGVNGEGSDLGVPLNTEAIRMTDTLELARIIGEGVPGTAMVAWKNVLGDEDIDAIIAFLQNWDVIAGSGIALTPPEPIEIDLDNPDDVLALGERIFNTTCVSCHGDNGTGGTGPALNSLQFLTRNTNEQIASTVINGGHRPNSTMPAFGDRLTSVEIGALVDYLRAWEPTATWVENPRGTQQGGGPPWLRATPDANAPLSPGGGNGGNGQGGGPPWRQNGTTTPGAGSSGAVTPGPTRLISGRVVTSTANMLTVELPEGVLVEVMLGPPWFWSENGIALSPGDQVELEGFESPDHMEVNWLVNLTTGQTIYLRTEAGVPVWSSGGNSSTTP